MQNKINSKMINNRKSPIQDDYIEKYFAEKELNLTEYSCAMKSHFRKFGNQMSGSGNHLCNYASLLA